MATSIESYLADGCGRCALAATPDCKTRKWQQELQALRNILLECPLSEEVKWGMPCYSFEGANILLISAFKESCTLSFFKGALLKDEQGILQKPGENTQAGRLIRFTQTQDIQAMASLVKAYIQEAIEIEKAGLKADFTASKELSLPAEFQQKLEQIPALKKAFESLTPGRKRSYILHFAQAKQSKTRISRIEKCIPQILAGKGFHEI